MKLLVILIVLLQQISCFCFFSGSFSRQFLKSCSFSFLSHDSPYVLRKFDSLLRVTSDGADDDDPINFKQNSSVIPSKFDRVLDDFIGKKFGAGEAFYGRRTSTLSDEDLLKLSDLEKSTSGKSRPLSLDEYCRIDRTFRDNAVLVVGGINSNTNSDVLQWIVYDLLEKGFTVRVGIIGERKQTGKCMVEGIRVFGLPGINVDMLELLNDGSERRFEAALEGVQAVVICDSFSPSLQASPSSSGNDPSAVEQLLRVAQAAREEGRGQLQKIVMVSRYLPAVTGEDAGAGGPLEWLEAAVSAVTAPLNGLFSLPPPALPAHFQVFAPWRKRSHEEVERLVRQSGYEYVVVRAPAVVQSSRPGAVEPMVAFTETQWDALRRAGRKSQSLSIGALDLAECAVQALLLEDVSDVSFTVCAGSLSSSSSSSSQSKQPQPSQTQRAARDTYYSILSLDDRAEPSEDEQIANAAQQEAAAQQIYSEMRSTYIIRPAEAYRSQVIEDGQVEKFWAGILSTLPKDNPTR